MNFVSVPTFEWYSKYFVQKLCGKNWAMSLTMSMVQPYIPTFAIYFDGGGPTNLLIHFF